MRSSFLPMAMSIAILVVLVACGQAAPDQPSEPDIAPTSSILLGATPAVSAVEGHFNPTEAVGGGANSSSAVPDAASAFASVPQAGQLRISANASPPGASAGDVQTVSIIAQDSGGLLKGLDAAGKQSLGNAMLTAAAATWPNASISLLISDPAGAASTIIGNHPKGGQNTVIAS
jgi:hypothetical protein